MTNWKGPIKGMFVEESSDDLRMFLATSKVSVGDVFFRQSVLPRFLLGLSFELSVRRHMNDSGPDQTAKEEKCRNCSEVQL